MKVLIGITAYLESAGWGPWQDVPTVLVPASYVDMTLAAGGTPLVIPPMALSEADAEGLLDRLDGLVLSGGVDVDPARYGEQPHDSVQTPRPDRDEAELLLARLARQSELPLLGICRGMQVMAVEAGGSLVQHLPDVVGHEDHSPRPGIYGTHHIEVLAGSRLCGILGDRNDEVNSYHHQAVASSPGYTISATAPDGTPEAMEAESGAFRLGVQWHPEAGTDSRLFAALVAAAAVKRGQ